MGYPAAAKETFPVAGLDRLGEFQTRFRFVNLLLFFLLFLSLLLVFSSSMRPFCLRRSGCGRGGTSSAHAHIFSPLGSLPSLNIFSLSNFCAFFVVERTAFTSVVFLSFSSER